MTIIGPIIITLILSFISLISLYYAFKPYNNDNEEYLNILGYDPSASVVYLFILWLCRKIFPQTVYIFVFRLISLAIAGLFLWGIVWFWMLLN